MNLEEFKANLKKTLSDKSKDIEKRIIEYRLLIRHFKEIARNDKNLSTKDFIEILAYCDDCFDKWETYELGKQLNKEINEKKIDFYEERISTLLNAKNEGWISQQEYDKQLLELLEDARNNKTITLQQINSLVIQGNEEYRF